MVHREDVLSFECAVDNIILGATRMVLDDAVQPVFESNGVSASLQVRRKGGSVGAPGIVDIASQDIPGGLDEDQQRLVTASPQLCLKAH
jgi:hypothetical protein